MDENLASIMISGQYIMGYLFSSIAMLRSGLYQHSVEFGIFDIETTNFRYPRRVLLFLSLVIIGLANFSAGLVLLSKEDNQRDTEAALPMMTSSSGWSQDYVTTVNITMTVSRTSLSAELLGLLPVLACVLICFGYAAGLGPVPWILFAELFPLPVRGPASSVTAVLRAITLFLSIKMFPAMLNNLDIGGSFLVSGVICALATFVAFVIVPETRGLTSQQLENLYKTDSEVNNNSHDKMFLVHPLQTSSDSDLEKCSSNLLSKKSLVYI